MNNKACNCGTGLKSPDQNCYQTTLLFVCCFTVIGLGKKVLTGQDKTRQIVLIVFLIFHNFFSNTEEITFQLPGQIFLIAHSTTTMQLVGLPVSLQTVYKTLCVFKPPFLVIVFHFYYLRVIHARNLVLLMFFVKWMV